MEDEKVLEKIFVKYHKNLKESFIARMKSEDDERSNIKFKIAAFVIHELSHNTPFWFKSLFLSNITVDDNHADMIDEKILKVENAFYEGVADYLIKMESEIDYVKKILAPFAEERDKKEFWKPVVADAFFIVGIYFSPAMEYSMHDHSGIEGLQTGRNFSSGCLYRALMPVAVL